jgi:hypothetical protein
MMIIRSCGLTEAGNAQYISYTDSYCRIVI